METIFTGTAGWHYRDWYGNVYPPKAPAGFGELDYLSRFFNTAEVNSTFYRPANRFMAAAWVRKTAHNPSFLFTVKLWQRFTHQREPYGSSEVDQYLEGVLPLAEAGRLGAILLQFPWSFKNSEESRAWLAGLFSVLGDFPLVAELRHGSWDNDATRDFLDRSRVGFAAIDQPLIGNSLPPRPELTGSIGYIRLHGRNYRNWFPSDKTEAPEKKNPGARYDYLYTAAEMETWTEHVQQIAQKAARTFVILNNHPRGQAAANALQMRAALGEEGLTAPASLLDTYPQLRDIARPA